DPQPITDEAVAVESEIFITDRLQSLLPSDGVVGQKARALAARRGGSVLAELGDEGVRIGVEVLKHASDGPRRALAAEDVVPPLVAASLVNRVRRDRKKVQSESQCVVAAAILRGSIVRVAVFVDRDGRNAPAH